MAISKIKQGDIINNLQVINFYKNDKNEKIFQVKCLKCGREFTKSRKALVKCGCKFCNTHTFIKGYNDVATVRPDLIKYFKYPKQAEEVSLGTTRHIELLCPRCGYEFTVDRLRTIANQAWQCPICGSKGSFNERLLKAVLNHYNICFESEKIFDWGIHYRYDFYLPQYNYIIECHGLQHYQNVNFELSLSAQQQIDNEKQIAVISHGMNYISLDCRKSTYQWFFASLQKTNLLSILNIDIQDIKNNICTIIYEYESENINKCVELYRQYLSANNISKILPFDKKTVANYLRVADKLGIIVYNEHTIENMRKAKASQGIHNHHKKKIICLENNKIYETYAEASVDTKCQRITISACCRHLSHFCVSQIDNQQRHFMFYDEYTNSTQKQIDAVLHFKQKCGRHRKE